MVLPGQVPGYKSSDVQLLPSSTTKHQVWELYQQAASRESMRHELLHFHIAVAATSSSCGRHEAH